MPKYRKKPIVVEAIQWSPGLNDVRFTLPDGMSFRVVRTWSGFSQNVELEIPTLEGVMKASPGDWIIKGIRDEYYPIKPDIFEETYEEDHGQG